MAERGIDRGNFDSGFSRPALPTYGLPEAPVDGSRYVRQDGQWVVEAGTDPSDAVPEANASSGGPGTSDEYARGDHYHPAIAISDISTLQTVLDSLATIAYVDATVAGGIGALDDLSDVTITTPAVGEVLTYDGAGWVNDVGSVVADLDDLGDVVITAVATDDVLKYNGTNWVNDTAPATGNVYSFQSSAPSSPVAGDEWTDSDTGVTYTYVNDGDTSQWVELGPSGFDKLDYSATTSTGYTFTADDADNAKGFNNASATTATIPPNSSVAFRIGTVLNAVRYGAGSVTFTAGSGVTFRNGLTAATIRSQYSVASAMKIGSDEWVLFGDLG
jgi:hypothetical protein